MAGFINPEEARAYKKARDAWLKAECRVLEATGIIPGCDQPSLAATAPIPHQEGSPMWHGYQVAIPAGWKALSPVFYPVPDAPDEPAQPGIPAALLKGSRRFRAGVLLCRQGEDGRAARREFDAGVLPEAAFLGQDGRYLQAGQRRPAYAVVPLAAPSPMCSGQTGCAECLVLLPLVDFSPGVPRESLPPLMMFVDGVRVHWHEAGSTPQSERWEAITSRALAAGDVFAELIELIAAMRRDNARLGRDDRDLGLLLCGVLGQVAASVVTP